MKVKHCSDQLSLINLSTCVSFLLLVVRVTSSADVIRTDDASLDLQSSAHQVAPREQPKGTSDSSIIINSIEDGLLSSGKIESERHHYDQPVEQAEKKISRIAEATTVRPVKPEPRNQQDDQQHQSQQDPVILDHRPSSIESPTIVGQDFMSTHHQATTVAPTNSPSNSPIQAPSTSLQSQYQPSQVSSATNWYPGTNSNQQNHATQSPPQQQQQRTQSSSNVQQNNNYGSTTSGSNQILTVAHPASINSIINDHQQQPFAIQPTGVSSNQIQSNSQPQQAIMQSVNGQPVILVNPSNIGLNGGRRISISNWLRGISSMLANIFNRRDHGQLTGQTSGNPFGNWIQLGPNAPHWLSQAQSAIQQQQYGTTAASSNRYAYLPGPSMTIQQQPSNAVPINMQPANILSGQAQPSYQMGDLQASGSMNYVAIQAPPNSVIQQPTTGSHMQVLVNTQQQQQQQGPAMHGSSSTAPSSRAITSENSAKNSQSSNIANSQPQQQSQNQQQVSSSQPSAINQPWVSTSSQQSGALTSFGSRTANSDQNLPLAHYSRYSSNPSD